MKLRKLLKILQMILLVFLSIILITNLYIITAQVAFKKELPKVFGFAQIIVVSGSMEPAIEVGDLLIIHQQDSYKINDIVTFRLGKSLITHRIIELFDDKAVTKGDINNVPDEPIELSQIEGKMLLRIPKAGDFILFLKTPFGILIMFIIAILLVEVPLIIDKKRDRKK